MNSELLWKRLHHLFDADDGSLREIWITNLSPEGVEAIFSYLREGSERLDDTTAFWSREEQREKSIELVPNAAALVTAGRADPFHFLCHGLTCNGVTIPDIGASVFPDRILLDYRMGAEWDGEKLLALFGVLKGIRGIDGDAKIGLDDHSAAKARRCLENAWQEFLQTKAEA